MLKYLRTITLVLVAFLGGAIVTMDAAGVTRISYGSALPTNCVDGNVFVKTSATVGVYWCSTAGSPGTWSSLGVGSGTVTNTGTLTANAVVVGNGSADVTALASLGSSGDVLTSNGAGAPPSFQAPTGGGGGGMALVESHTASTSASLDFTSCISSTYDVYMFQFQNVLPVNDATTIHAHVSTNGGSTWDTTLGMYDYQIWVYSIGGTAVTGSNSSTRWVFQYDAGQGLKNTSTRGMNGSMYLYDPLSTTSYKNYVANTGGYISDNQYKRNDSAGAYNSTTAVNAIQFVASGGNIASGTIRCYGLTK